MKAHVVGVLTILGGLAAIVGWIVLIVSHFTFEVGFPILFSPVFAYLIFGTFAKPVGDWVLDKVGK